MKRYVMVLGVLVVATAFVPRGAVSGEQAAAQPQQPAQTAQPAEGRGGRGRGLSPEQQAALAAQTELEKNTPQIPYDAVSLPLMPTGHTIGETEGVAINSKKHLFVYTRSGNVGPARGAQAAELFEFDENGKFVKEWGQNAYGFSYAHAIRVRQGRQPLGDRRRLEHGDEVQPAGARDAWCSGGRTKRSTIWSGSSRKGARSTRRSCRARRRRGTRRQLRPSDRRRVRHAGRHLRRRRLHNSRVAKFTKDGDFVKAIGTRGNQPGQFNTPHTIANDAKGNIYVGDRGNQRIQVFDPDLNPVRVISNVRAPWAVCITPPNAQGQQFLFSSDAGGKIYKEDLEGHLLGWFGTIGKKVGQFYWVHEMHCVNENELYTGEAQNWRVQHITMKAAPKSSAAR